VSLLWRNGWWDLCVPIPAGKLGFMLWEAVHKRSTGASEGRIPVGPWPMGRVVREKRRFPEEKRRGSGDAPLLLERRRRSQITGMLLGASPEKRQALGLLVRGSALLPRGAFFPGSASRWRFSRREAFIVGASQEKHASPDKRRRGLELFGRSPKGKVKVSQMEKVRRAPPDGMAWGDVSRRCNRVHIPGRNVFSCLAALNWRFCHRVSEHVGRSARGKCEEAGVCRQEKRQPMALLQRSPNPWRPSREATALALLGRGAAAGKST
jgi:hypothetical protein